MKWTDATHVVAAADVTTAYQTVPGTYDWATGWIDVGNAEEVLLQLDYTDTDATSLELLIETEEFGGTSGYRIYKVESGAGTVDEASFLVADLPGGAGAASAFSVLIRAISFRRFRVAAKQTGGSASGNTLALEVLAGGGHP